MNIVRSLAVAVLLLVAGCAGDPLIVKATDQSLPPPPADKAQIVFLNPANSISGAFYSVLFDITDPNHRAFLGMVGPKNKLAVNMVPGKHMLMSEVGLTGHVLRADVEAGKRYFVVVRFLYGRGLQLRPIRTTGNSEFSVGNPKFEEWRTAFEVVAKTDAADQWYAKYGEVVEKAQAKAMADWEAKTPDQKAELTLNKEDAFSK